MEFDPLKSGYPDIRLLFDAKPCPSVGGAIGPPTLSSPMQILRAAYTSFFNRKYKECGHLFQGRYKALPVEKNGYLLELVCWIDPNSHWAKLEKKIGSILGPTMSTISGEAQPDSNSLQMGFR